MKIGHLIVLAFFCFAFVSCGDRKERVRQNFLNAETVENTQLEAVKVCELGLEGIPIFIEAIKKNIHSQDSLLGYGKLLISIRQLHMMAKKGVHSEKSVPVLLKVLKSQRSISDSLITAEAIRIITGLDVGYDEEFVRSYKLSDEPSRLEMISKWEDYIKK